MNQNPTINNQKRLSTRRHHRITNARIKYLYSQHFSFEMSPEQSKTADALGAYQALDAINWNSEMAMTEISEPSAVQNPPQNAFTPASVDTEFAADFRIHAKHLAEEHWMQTRRDQIYGFDPVSSISSFLSEVPAEQGGSGGGRNSGRRRLKLRPKPGRSIAVAAALCYGATRLGGRALSSGLILLLQPAVHIVDTLLLFSRRRAPSQPQLPSSRPPPARWRLSGAKCDQADPQADGNAEVGAVGGGGGGDGGGCGAGEPANPVAAGPCPPRPSSIYVSESVQRL